MSVKMFVAGALLLPLASLAASPVLAADAPVAGKPTSAKLCNNCHKPDAGNLRGHWESVAMKTSSIQLKIDDRSEIVKFDKNKIQVLNTSEKGDVEKMLRSIKKGHEVRIEFSEQNGAKVASVVSAKPPIKLSEKEKISLAEVEKLVVQGPEKGKYFLFDSRPAPRFKEWAIPTAVSLPFPDFDNNLDQLPTDKEALIVFYCSGITCNMSPGSQKKAKALGYKNVKVFVEGTPAWTTKNFGVVAPANLNAAYKDIPYVLLDARKADVAEAGFIKGAVAFPKADPQSLKQLPKKDMKAPIIIYDENGKGNASAVARDIIKAGYSNVILLAGGIEAWKAAQLPIETGKLATTITYVPKPKPGDYGIEPFKKLVAAIPADTVLIDVRNSDELADGIIKGSVNIPADQIDQHVAEFKDKKVVTFCNTGTRAEMAYHALKAKGFTNVFFFNGKVDFDEGEVEISK